jgi:hypothetical protein
MRYYRSISTQWLRGARQFPVLVLTGPRQIGKTTQLRSVFPNHRCVSLDFQAWRTYPNAIRRNSSARPRRPRWLTKCNMHPSGFRIPKRCWMPIVMRWSVCAGVKWGRCCSRHVLQWSQLGYRTRDLAPFRTWQTTRSVRSSAPTLSLRLEPSCELYATCSALSTANGGASQSWHFC